MQLIVNHCQELVHKLTMTTINASVLNTPKHHLRRFTNLYCFHKTQKIYLSTKKHTSSLRRVCDETKQQLCEKKINIFMEQSKLLQDA